MRRAPRRSMACAVPGCTKTLVLTEYKINKRRYPPTCSRSHANILRSLDGVRQDAAGAVLGEQGVNAGGIRRLGAIPRRRRAGLPRLTRGGLPSRAQADKGLARG